MTGIPVLRGLADETANLPDLGKAIANLTSGGNYDLQQKLKQAIASDPSIAESLGQLAKDNPQLFGALKLGKLGEQIAQTPPGYKQKSEELNLKRGEADYQETIARTQDYKDNADLAPIRKSILQYNLRDLQDKNKQLDEQAAKFPGLKRPLGTIIDDLMAGKNPEELGYIAANPALHATFQSLLNNKQQLRQINAAADRQNSTQDAYLERLFLREDKDRSKKLLDNGTEFFKKYGVGSPQTWAAYLDSPEIQSTVENLVQNGLKPGDENNEHLRNLRAIGVALKQDRNIKLDAASRSNSLAADKILKDIANKKVEQTSGLTQVNGFLAENAQNRGSRHIMIIPRDQVAGANWWQKHFGNTPLVAVDAITHEKLADVSDSMDDVNKFENQPATGQYTPQQLAKAKAGLPNATPSDLSNLQKTDPLIYQALLPDIQRLEESRKATKGK